MRGVIVMAMALLLLRGERLRERKKAAVAGRLCLGMRL
jgi:hypothetical protein